MRRRDFIALLSSAAVWPLAARAQQPEGVRRIAVLQILAENDPELVARHAAFEQTLQTLGWTRDRNVRIDYRWAAGEADRVNKYAVELLALKPDVILASGSITVTPLLRSTRTVPIVFVQVVDPVGGGLVESLARPGGNATGFTQFDYNLSGKWLELLKEIAPRVTRVRGHSRPHPRSGDRSVRRHSVGGAVPWDRVAPDQCPRDSGNRASGCRIRWFFEWRIDCDIGRYGVSSRSNRPACGTP